MSALGLNSTRNSPSVNVLPAQRSIVLADSKYRSRNKVTDINGEVIQVETNTESPYNFQANFSAALVGKEIIYQKLYWNQPIYAHSNDNNELRFQINGDDTVTYVVYAVPFIMYNEYDGNEPGIPWPAPKVNSYASMMELGFNGDVRELNTNLQLANSDKANPGNLYDADGFQMTVYFRYSPPQGFAIAFAPSINPNIPVYTIRLLPSTYIAFAHFVHGFGIFDDNSLSTNFVPRNQWTVAYFSDDTPNLLPFRYITIRSQELTKDRRMISFQNANSNRFNNEMAIIALSPVTTGTYHVENVGDDATVISKRDDYQPLTARIIITDENGNPILCDSPISNLLQTPDIVNDTTKNSFLFGAKAGRGNVDFVNDIVFGAERANIASTPGVFPVKIAQSTVVAPLGCIGYDDPNTLIGPYVGSQKFVDPNFWTWWNDPRRSGAETVIMRQCIPIIVNPTGGDVSFPSFPDSYVYAGFNSSVTVQNPFELFGNVTNNVIKPEVSVFTWDPNKNRNPTISLDANVYPFAFGVGGDITQFENVYTFIIGYSYELNDIVLATNAILGLSYWPISMGKILVNGVDVFSMTLNPTYSGLNEVQTVAFYLSFQNSVYGNPTVPGTLGYAKVAMNFPGGFPPAVPMLTFGNPNLEQIQNGYLPPASNIDVQDGYEFGNPQAMAKCEELIHEFVLVLDKN